MISDFTDKSKFTTNLNSYDENREIVKQSQLFGVIIRYDLKLDKNTVYLKKKSIVNIRIAEKTAKSKMATRGPKMADGGWKGVYP